MHLILRRNRAAGVEMEKNIESVENIIPIDLVEIKKAKTKEAIRFWAKLYHAAPPDTEETADAIVESITDDAATDDVNDDPAAGEISEASDMALPPPVPDVSPVTTSPPTTTAADAPTHLGALHRPQRPAAPRRHCVSVLALHQHTGAGVGVHSRRSR